MREFLSFIRPVPKRFEKRILQLLLARLLTFHRKAVASVNCMYYCSVSPGYRYCARGLSSNMASADPELQDGLSASKLFSNGSGLTYKLVRTRLSA